MMNESRTIPIPPSGSPNASGINAEIMQIASDTDSGKKNGYKNFRKYQYRILQDKYFYNS